MTRTLKGLVAAGVLAFSGSLLAQSAAGPEISFDATDLLKTPDNVFVGEVGGVGQNSKGQIFVYTPDRPSVRNARRQPDLLPERLAAVSVRSDR